MIIHRSHETLRLWYYRWHISTTTGSCQHCSPCGGDPTRTSDSQHDAGWTIALTNRNQQQHHLTEIPNHQTIMNNYIIKENISDHFDVGCLMIAYRQLLFTSWLCASIPNRYRQQSRGYNHNSGATVNAFPVHEHLQKMSLVSWFPGI